MEWLRPLLASCSSSSRRAEANVSEDKTSDRGAKPLHVVVHYPPAAEPFKDKDAARAETLGQLKARVLSAFVLTEGSLPDGSVATYTLYNKKTPLENTSETLGAIAGDDHELQLKLAQQITQGHT